MRDLVYYFAVTDIHETNPTVHNPDFLSINATVELEFCFST